MGAFLSKIRKGVISAFALGLFFYIAPRLYAMARRYRSKRSLKTYNPKVVIIGAGFSGICTAINLIEKLGFTNFIILERHKSVGGTWYTNTYPGCACDVPSYLYSYSFDQKYDWSNEFAPQPEILNYIRDVVKKHNIEKYIQYDSSVTHMKYDENNGKWTIKYGLFSAKDNPNREIKTMTCNILVSCTGGLTSENIKYPYPDKLLNKYGGIITHSGRWNNNYSYSNKNIAVIGSGTSAIQIVPAMQKIANKVYVFQRSPTYIYPKMDYKISKWKHFLYYYFPFFMYLRRFIIFFMMETIVYSLLQKKNTGIQKRAIAVFKQHRDASIKSGDKYLINAVTPVGYTPGCKRMGLSNEWFPALDSSNTELIVNKKDSTNCIIDFYNKGIILKDQRKIEVDAIVFATGYDVTGKSMMKEDSRDVIGKNNISLKQLWSAEYGPYTYKGVTLNGFPNYFFVLGPGSGVGSNSFLTSIEIGSNYVIQLIEQFIRNKCKSIEIKKEIEQKYNDKLDKRMRDMIWTQTERNWYKLENGRVHTLFGWSMTTWWWYLRKPNMDEFDMIKI